MCFRSTLQCEEQKLLWIVTNGHWHVLFCVLFCNAEGVICCLTSDNRTIGQQAKLLRLRALQYSRLPYYLWWMQQRSTLRSMCVICHIFFLPAGTHLSSASVLRCCFTALTVWIHCLLPNLFKSRNGWILQGLLITFLTANDWIKQLLLLVTIFTVSDANRPKNDIDTM